MTLTPEFLVHDIFPTGEVHMFVGPSGSGKTTYLFQFLTSWSKGDSFFGHAAFPVPYVYVSCDRTMPSVLRTLKRMGITEPIPVFCARDLKVKNVKELLNAVRAAHPTARLLILDGFARYAPGGKINDYVAVADFLGDIGSWCQQYNSTIFGVAHAPKTKEGESYVNPRERALGSVAWAAYIETIINFETLRPNDPDSSTRRIHILPRNAAEESFEMSFKDGLLARVDKTANPSSSKVKEFIASLEADGEFTVEELVIHSKASKQYVYKVLTEMRDRGWVLRLKPGVYRRIPVVTNGFHAPGFGGG